MDRLSTAADPLLRLESIDDYDENGNPTTFTDRNGQTRTATYDDRMASVQFGPGESTAFTWDAAGNVTDIVDSTGGTLVRTLDTEFGQSHYAESVSVAWKANFTEKVGLQ
jgi:YD repeat-containing protein